MNIQLRKYTYSFNIVLLYSFVKKNKIKLQFKLKT